MNTFIEYSKINDKLKQKIEIPDICFSDDLDSQIQIMVMYFKKKKTSKIKKLIDFNFISQYAGCFMTILYIFNEVKQIDFSDVIVIGIRLLGILDDIENDIINEYHNEDSDYFSIGKTSGTIFNRLFHIMKNSTAKI